MSAQSKTVNFDARQANYLLEQAEGGYHPLFGNELIRRALCGSPEQEREDSEIVQELHDVIVEITELVDVRSQREFIEALPESVQNLVVHLYFRFLDQFMARHPITLH
ncbi:MAG: hypothetical protein ACI9OJ_004704 [Myxococcota bacterium]|jgi:hypothetical protein